MQSNKSSLLKSVFPVSLSANTYFFMVQAQGIMLRDNVRTIGQMIRLYTNKNSTVNGTGKWPHTWNFLSYFDALTVLAKHKDSTLVYKL